MPVLDMRCSVDMATVLSEGAQTFSQYFDRSQPKMFSESHASAIRTLIPPSHSHSTRKPHSIQVYACLSLKVTAWYVPVRFSSRAPSPFSKQLLPVAKVNKSFSSSFSLYDASASLATSLLPKRKHIMANKNSQQAQASTNYKEAFSLFDKRGNGRVPRDSLGDLLRACGQNPTLAEIRELESSVGGDCMLNTHTQYGTTRETQSRVRDVYG